MITRQTNDLQGRYIASLSHSSTVTLNLQELYKIGAFSYQIALLQRPQPRIFAYQQSQDSFLLVIPLIFHRNQHQRTQLLIQFLILCSQTVTVPSEGDYLHDLRQLLGRFGLHWCQKRGNNVVKLYIEGQCGISFLDLITFQAIQLKSNLKQLLTLKNEKAFEYCIKSFKSIYLPQIYETCEDDIGNALENVVNKVKHIFEILECKQRFGMIYEEMGHKRRGLKQLMKLLEQMAICRKITTVGDQQCEELVNVQISKIIDQELQSKKQQLSKMKNKEQQHFITKILSSLLTKLRNLDFDVNDQKFMIINGKIIEKVYELRQQKIEKEQKEKEELKEILQQKQQEIVSIKNQLQKIESEFKNKTQGISIKDLKQPLQILNNNNQKLQKTGLHKAKEKFKDGFRWKMTSEYEGSGQVGRI